MSLWDNRLCPLVVQQLVSNVCVISPTPLPLFLRGSFPWLCWRWTGCTQASVAGFVSQGFCLLLFPHLWGGGSCYRLFFNGNTHPRTGLYDKLGKYEQGTDLHYLFVYVIMHWWLSVDRSNTSYSVAVILRTIRMDVRIFSFIRYDHHCCGLSVGRDLDRLCSFSFYFQFAVIVMFFATVVYLCLSFLQWILGAFSFKP